jgi:hypothetical protein
MKGYWEDQIHRSELEVGRTLRYQARHKAQGLCRCCPKKAAEGSTRCEEHLEKNRRYARKYYEESKRDMERGAAGLPG